MLKAESAAFLPLHSIRALLPIRIVTLQQKTTFFIAENSIEISCHGSPVVVREIIKVLLKNGARLAEPGEFTKRAFLNGRMDLVQA